MLVADGALYKSAVRASSVDHGLLFHSAHPTIAQDAVFFGPDTYRFLRQLRACVPTLAQAAGTRRPALRCVDIGCGSGAAAILLARLLPQASVHAVDINGEALALTAVNAALAGVKVSPGHSDLLSALPGQFDLIVANPPYLVDPAQRSYRDGGGGLGGALSLAVVDAAIERLAPGGSLLLYTGAAIVHGIDEVHDAARARLAQAGFSWHYEEIDPDVFGEELATPAYAHVDRIAAVWLRASRPFTV
jgi:methylase of polypeptide subunit release factors